MKRKNFVHARCVCVVFFFPLLVLQPVSVFWLSPNKSFLRTEIVPQFLSWWLSKCGAPVLWLVLGGMMCDPLDRDRIKTALPPCCQKINMACEEKG